MLTIQSKVALLQIGPFLLVGGSIEDMSNFIVGLHTQAAARKWSIRMKSVQDIVIHFKLHLW